jgi:phosphoenolpyruvate carboxykinase (GTP)
VSRWCCRRGHARGHRSAGARRRPGAGAQLAPARVPAPGALDTEGLDLSEEQLAAALDVDVEEWRAELPQIQEWFEKFGDDLPAVLWTELDGLRARLG